MAGKQLGKFRQWAGEMIAFSKEKTTLTDEFLELENDVELRRIGGDKVLHAASTGYHAYLLKKKTSEALDDPAKVAPGEALGLVMINHGEEFGEDSAFGQSLVKYGRAHLKLAALQETYAGALAEGFINNIERTMDDITEYQAQRKKLDSRRLTYDAALTKASKQYKKEKEQKEAEQEVATAKERYDEVSEEVQSRMIAIQENEVQQWQDLTAFLDMQLKFANDYVTIMQDLKTQWIAESSIKRLQPLRPSSNPHSFPSRSNSTRRERPRKNSSAKGEQDESGSEPESPQTSRPAVASRSRTQSKSDSVSRPVGSLSRRGSSVAEKDTLKEKDSVSGKRTGVAGWATSAVSSVASVASIGRGGAKTDKERDRDPERKFSDLHSDEEGEHGGAESEKERNGRSSSRGSVRTLSKRSPAARTAPLPPDNGRPKIQSAPSQAPKKTARALFDYNPTAGDELQFSVGDEIVILNEVADEWWQGEVVSGPNAGRQGLFPLAYVEVIKLPLVPPRPPLPNRSSASISSGSGASFSGSKTSLQEKAARALRDDPPRDGDEDGVFGDKRYAVQSPTSPLAVVQQPEPSDDDSDDGGKPLMRSTPSSGSLRTKANPAPSTPGKKPPPPPPPSRRATTSGASLGPGHAVRSLSAGSLGSMLKSASPFGDSGRPPTDNVVAARHCDECDCDEYAQNKFKPKGYCNSCFHIHPLA
ncbi:BAR-domain-containing protein [Auriculariales sp. MPI-PUGE-AT-0066]|nr:BAR-domain-containing protein [Auriculariales sp. MPI-PUGE-AT-0066]